MQSKTYPITVKGKQCNLRLLGSSYVPDFEKVTSVAGLIFDNDSILAVRLKNRGVDIPGGHTEAYDKSPEETLKREVLEEASATIRDLKLLDVIESDYLGSEPNQLTYMLIYSAKLDQLLPYDETDEVACERLRLPKESFLELYTGGNKALMKALVKNACQSR